MISIELMQAVTKYGDLRYDQGVIAANYTGDGELRDAAGESSKALEALVLAIREIQHKAIRYDQLTAKS